MFPSPPNTDANNCGHEQQNVSPHPHPNPELIHCFSSCASQAKARNSCAQRCPDGRFSFPPLGHACIQSLDFKNHGLTLSGRPNRPRPRRAPCAAGESGSGRRSQCPCGSAREGRPGMPHRSRNPRGGAPGAAGAGSGRLGAAGLVVSSAEIHRQWTIQRHGMRSGLGRAQGAAHKRPGSRPSASRLLSGCQRGTSRHRDTRPTPSVAARTAMRPDISGRVRGPPRAPGYTDPAAGSSATAAAGRDTAAVARGCADPLPRGSRACGRRPLTAAVEARPVPSRAQLRARALLAGREASDNERPEARPLAPQAPAPRPSLTTGRTERMRREEEAGRVTDRNVVESWRETCRLGFVERMQTASKAGVQSTSGITSSSVHSPLKPNVRRYAAMSSKFVS